MWWLLAQLLPHLTSAHKGIVYLCYKQVPPDFHSSRKTVESENALCNYTKLKYLLSEKPSIIYLSSAENSVSQKNLISLFH